MVVPKNFIDPSGTPLEFISFKNKFVQIVEKVSVFRAYPCPFQTKIALVPETATTPSVLGGKPMPKPLVVRAGISMGVRAVTANPSANAARIPVNITAQAKKPLMGCMQMHTQIQCLHF